MDRPRRTGSIAIAIAIASVLLLSWVAGGVGLRCFYWDSRVQEDSADMLWLRSDMLYHVEPGADMRSNRYVMCSR